MAAVIGALRVDLGLNSAEFSAGLKKAQNGLNKFAKVAGVGLAAVATAAAAAGVALGMAVKGAIDNADQMGELAQSVGVSVEALTSLGYAAKMSGSDTETLATGLRKLSQNMLTVAQGSAGPVATAFNALGISIKNADGSLRASDAVLVDIAAKFAMMEDGATKTALAVQLFGRSGAELIPFLNQGRSGISALTAEADRLGITISGNTANAAGQFNDTLDRLRATFDGVINKIMAGALPSLNQLANKLADPAFAAAAAALAQGVVGAINAIVDAVSLASTKLTELGNLLNWMASHDWTTSEIDPARLEARERGAMAELRGQLSRGETEAPDSAFMNSIFGAPAPQAVASNQELAASFVPVIENTNAAGAATSALNAVMTEGKAVFTATRTPAEAYGIEVERLNMLLQKGAIDQDTYNRAVTQAQDAFKEAESSGNQLASTLSSGLANVFTSIIDGSKSAISAIGDLIKSLANLLIQKGFEALVGGMFGGGGGFLSGLLGGIGKNANGTKNWRGGLTMVGERGPELINLNRGSQVIPNSALRQGGGGEILVTAQVEVMNGSLVNTMTKVAGQVAGQQIKQNNKQLPGLMRDSNQRYG